MHSIVWSQLWNSLSEQKDALPDAHYEEKEGQHKGGGTGGAGLITDIWTIVFITANEAHFQL